MKAKTPDELSNLLGFFDARPINWNGYRTADNLVSPWDIAEDAREKFNTGGPDMIALRLLWHQLCGVAAIVNRVWTAEETPDVHGILLADDVGVGKTAQVMASIAFIQLVFQLEKQKQPRPPIISTLSYSLLHIHHSLLIIKRIEDRLHFMGKGCVPNLPHAIVIPNSLVDQWRRELKTFFKAHTLDIFQLPTAAAELQSYFTAPDGLWKRSHHDDIFRIVLVPHSVRILHTILT